MVIVSDRRQSVESAESAPGTPTIATKDDTKHTNTNNTPNPSNSTSFSFPLLKNKEILLCLDDIGIRLTEEELLQPHCRRNRVKPVFTALVSFSDVHT